LVFFRKQLDQQLRTVLGGSPDDPSADLVVFIDGDQLDPIHFSNGAVTLLLVNVEEDRLFRAADPFQRRLPDTTSLAVQPDLNLVLSVLLVARFKQYDAAWRHLSKIIEYLQSICVFEAATNPDLPPGVERLAVEMINSTAADHNSIWSALRTSQHPSLAYRLKFARYLDQSGVAAPSTTQVDVTTKQISQ
jgi:hypothetical protein